MQRRRLLAAGAAGEPSDERCANGVEEPPLRGRWGRPALVRALLCLAAAALACGLVSARRWWQPQRPRGALGPGGAALDGPTRLTELRQEELPTAPDLEWRVVSHSPRIFVNDNFLSPGECEFLKGLVAGRMQPAKVVQQASNKWDTQMEVRNNKQIWLTQQEEGEIPLLRHMIKRMHRAARVPDDDAEALQIGHYDIGEKYELHLDSDPENEVPRPATMIVYLHEAEAGGETLFPLKSEARNACLGWKTLDNGTGVYGIKHCCQNGHPGSIKIPTKVGRAVLFWNHDLSGQRDTGAEHAACPVQRGQKWIAQRWFRFSPYQMLVHPPDPRFDGLPPLARNAVGGGGLPGRLDARVLSQKGPRVYLVEDLLSPEECQHLIALGGPGEFYEENGMHRQWLHPDVEASDPIIRAVVKRLHRAALVPEAFGESLQLGRTRPGDRVQLHLDSWPDSGLVRPYTILVYLDGDGSSLDGATVFPLRRCSGIEECCTTAARSGPVDGGPLAIPPKAGRALLFASHSLDGALDRESVHGSCPAGPTGKWVAQRWFRAGPQNGLDYGVDPVFDIPGVFQI